VRSVTTLLSDLFDMDLFAAMLAEKFIRVQQHSTEDLFIVNYSESAVYTKTWNEVTLQCRGLIYDKYSRVVARPFKKFFNLGEYGPEHIWSEGLVEVTDKMDGSLGILYQYPSNGQWAIATRGSFHSDQATKATQILREKYPRWTPPHRTTTYLFEIVYPSNRIVLDYGDQEDLVLIGGVNQWNGRCVSPRTLGIGQPFPHTQIFHADSLAEALAIPPRQNAEGIVVRFVADDMMVKIKQEDYVLQHAIVTNCTNRSVWEILSRGESLPEKAAFMPDEFHAWMVRTARQLQFEKELWIDLSQQEYDQLLWVLSAGHPNGWSRKDFAELALKSRNRAAMFKLYDGHPLDELAWKAVRPAEIVRPFAQTEETS
jgi:RNA ligase